MVAKYHSYGQDDVGPGVPVQYIQYSNSTVQYSAGVPGVEVGELARGHVQLVRDLHLQRTRAGTITLREGSLTAQL